MTTGVLVLLGYLDDDTIRNNIMPSTRLVMSVSFYFDQAEMMTAKLGALIAEAVSSRLDAKPLNTGLLDGDDRLLALKQIIKNPKEGKHEGYSGKSENLMRSRYCNEQQRGRSDSRSLGGNRR